MYRLIGDNHALGGLSFSAQVFLRSLDRVRSKLASDAGVTGIELRALGRIAEESGVSEVSLAGYLEAAPGTVEALADGLASRGFLTRSIPSPRGAGSNLSLTPEGHSLMQGVFLDFQDSIETASGSLDEEHQIALNSGLLKMARKLDAAADGTPPPREMPLDLAG